VIRGDEYPKEYKDFPIDIINVRIDPNLQTGAIYDEKLSGYENDLYVVYLIFGPFAGESSINHELRHAYEDYMRISGGSTPLKSTKETINLFSGDFEKLMTTRRGFYEPYNALFHGLYFTSRIERSAFADNVYDNSTWIIKTVIQYMTYADPQKILNSEYYDLSNEWEKLKKDFKIPVINKFNNYENFIIWACKEIQNKGRKTLNKLRKVQFHREQNKKKGGN